MAISSVKDVGGRSARGTGVELVPKVFDVAFSNSYTANGEAITPATFGLSSIVFVDINHSVDGSVVVWDTANSKLRIFVTGSGSGAKLSEVAGASDQSGVTARIMVWGRP